MMNPPQKNRVIAHVDMDAFFASIEQLDDPKLRGRPVIVGADPKNGKGRGVVAAASYEARKFGIHSAQPISQAFRLCPNGAFVRPHFDRYVELSDGIMSVLETYTPLVEPASLDEAYLDLTGTERLIGDVASTGQKIQKDIFNAVRLTASVGIGPNKLIAKMASDFRKPDGLVVIRAGDVREFLDPLPVQKLWGVGAKTAARLESFGIRNVSDVKRYAEKDLVRLLGSFGGWLVESSMGIDETPVTPDREAKSISNETTFETDTGDRDLIRSVLLELAEKVGHRMRRHRLAGKTMELKIRFEDFSTKTRRQTLSKPTDLTDSIFSSALSLMRPFESDRRKIRLLGVGVSNLVPEDRIQTDLFDSGENLKRKKVHEAVDRLKEKFGEEIVTRASKR
jgi:DNA polymerase IV